MEDGVLDLACGRGRNGLFLARHHIPVTFADNSESALREVEQRSADYSEYTSTWLVDLERTGSDPLSGKMFDVILVFNYLHRPIMNSIKTAVSPGGLVLYETFTVDQARYGKPSNPDYLLRKEELREYFQDWDILFYREGERTDPPRVQASLLARKPGMSD